MQDAFWREAKMPVEVLYFLVIVMGCGNIVMGRLAIRLMLTRPGGPKTTVGMVVAALRQALPRAKTA